MLIDDGVPKFSSLYAYIKIGIYIYIYAYIKIGMVLDCPNIPRIIHWGCPEDIETYMQETGRPGRVVYPLQLNSTVVSKFQLHIPAKK